MVGPTAVGKTALAVEVALHFNCEIISADSRQFYREISIGTAKPTAAEMREVPHHFIDNLSIVDPYSAGQFEIEAEAKLRQLFTHKDLVVVVGGSGLFINALAFGLDDIPSTPQEIRAALNQECEEKGLPAMVEKLLAIDPEYAQSVDVKNKHRVLRGLEVFETASTRLSDLQKRKPKTKDFNAIWIGLDLPRATLYQRINQRVDLMLSQGLLEEVELLRPYSHLSPLKTVGYQEFYLPDLTVETAVECVKRNSRRYAKRQLTWFRKNQRVTWFSPQEKEKIFQLITDQIDERTH